ncbi:unnamed protein product [Dracunculus medinensis]|uniref:Uncharacterized protein n=1 Tax=Dracunculus medinensis TaxID=318479 RepID=A0A0N4U618_DRAME|nr:unnamed protein product [Dracunculus medinensis]
MCGRIVPIHLAFSLNLYECRNLKKARPMAGVPIGFAGLIPNIEMQSSKSVREGRSWTVGLVPNCDEHGITVFCKRG